MMATCGQMKGPVWVSILMRRKPLDIQSVFLPSNGRKAAGPMERSGLHNCSLVLKAPDSLIRFESAQGRGAWVRVIMGEGRKRQIRETCKQLGLPVVRILSVRIGSLKLGNLKPDRKSPRLN